MLTNTIDRLVRIVVAADLGNTEIVPRAYCSRGCGEQCNSSSRKNKLIEHNVVSWS